MSTEEVNELLYELDAWRCRVPMRVQDKNIPQQTEDRVQAMYLQTALLLLRPSLLNDDIDDNLLSRFALIAADACEVCLLKD